MALDHRCHSFEPRQWVSIQRELSSSRIALKRGVAVPGRWLASGGLFLSHPRRKGALPTHESATDVPNCSLGHTRCYRRSAIRDVGLVGKQSRHAGTPRSRVRGPLPAVTPGAMWCGRSHRAVVADRLCQQRDRRPRPLGGPRMLELTRGSLRRRALALQASGVCRARHCDGPPRRTLGRPFLRRARRGSSCGPRVAPR